MLNGTEAQLEYNNFWPFMSIKGQKLSGIDVNLA